MKVINNFKQTYLSAITHNILFKMSIRTSYVHNINIEQKVWLMAHRHIVFV